MSYPLPPRNKRRPGDFDFGKQLGTGSLSMVFMCTEYDTGKHFAMKIFDRKYLISQKKDADVSMEEHCLRRCNHPGIVKLHACFSDETSRYLVMELCPGGELWDLVRDVGLPDNFARLYLSQVIEAVSYLRDAGIVHRDLKAENVLLGAQGNCKLVDFGAAKDLANPHIKGAGVTGYKTVQEDSVGTPNFMAPEAVNNKFTDCRSDIWSLGCMVYQVVTGLVPFGCDLFMVYELSLKAHLEIPPGIHPGVRDLIKRMVVLDPDARLGASNIQQIRSHPYFAAIDAARGDGPRFEGAHRRSAPVLSLADCCVRAVGRRWTAFASRVDAQAERLPDKFREVFSRFRTAAEDAARRKERRDRGEFGGDSS